MCRKIKAVRIRADFRSDKKIRNAYKSSISHFLTRGDNRI